MNGKADDCVGNFRAVGSRICRGNLSQSEIEFMRNSQRVISFFVCSSFRDMKEERAYLHEVVLPRVNEEYEKRGFRLEFKDPRGRRGPRKTPTARPACPRAWRSSTVPGPALSACSARITAR